MSEENKEMIINTTEEHDKKSAQVPPVPEDAKSQDVMEEAEKVKAAAIDEMEKASQKALDAMREADNTENAEIVDEAEKKLDTIFDDFRTWVETNTQPEKVKENLDKLKDDTASLLNNTREKVIETANSEQFKQTMQSGKDFVTGTATIIGDGFKYGYDKLMEVPEFRKAAGHVDEGINRLRQNETLKTIADKAEEGINNLNKALFEGIHSFFDHAEAPKTEAKGADDLPETPDQTETK